MFKLGKKSRQNLIGVHPDLVAVVERAIELTTQDFTVFEGTRSIAKQAENLLKGVSRTLDASRHLTGPDGYSHAVDLVPLLNDKPVWEWVLIYPIAEAVKQAAKEFNIKIRWGGSWDVLLNDESETAKKIVESYVSRRKKLGKSAFIDGPHFELPLSPEYPQAKAQVG